MIETITALVLSLTVPHGTRPRLRCYVVDMCALWIVFEPLKRIPTYAMVRTFSPQMLWLMESFFFDVLETHTTEQAIINIFTQVINYAVVTGHSWMLFKVRRLIRNYKRMTFRIMQQLTMNLLLKKPCNENTDIKQWLRSSLGSPFPL